MDGKRVDAVEYCDVVLEYERIGLASEEEDIVFGKSYESAAVDDIENSCRCGHDRKKRTLHWVGVASNGNDLRLIVIVSFVFDVQCVTK